MKEKKADEEEVFDRINSRVRAAFTAAGVTQFIASYCVGGDHHAILSIAPDHALELIQMLLDEQRDLASQTITRLLQILDDNGIDYEEALWKQEND